MSEQIKAGDLVMVVRKGYFCCPPTGETLGNIFVVASLSVTAFSCALCGSIQSERLMAWRDSGWVFEPHRLKRIPPLDELEGVDEKETLHA